MNWLLLQNSLAVSIATAFAATTLGFGAALCASVLPRRMQLSIVVLAIVAIVMPPFVVTNCWLDLLGTNGALRRWVPLNIFSLPGAVLILTLLAWPLPFLLVWTAWRKIEREQLEVDPLLRGVALLRTLLWPTAKHAVWLGAAITFVLALNNFAVPSILQVKVYPAEMWVAFNTSLDAPGAFKMSWPMLTAPLLLLVLAQTRRVEWPRRQGFVDARVWRQQLGNAWVGTSAAIAVIAVTLSVITPLLQLVSASRTWTEFTPALSAGINALTNSTLYSVSAALLASIFGLMLWRVRIAAVLWFLFLVPGVLLGVAFTLGFNHPSLNWFYRSAAVVIVAFALRYVAFAWSSGRAAMRDLDRNTIDAVRLEGASGFTLFRHATWPQIAPQVSFVAYVIYLLCLWDVETIVTIVPPNGETLALRIFNMLHYGHSTHVNTLCVLLLLLALAPLALWGMVRLFSMRRASRALVAIASMIVLASCSHSEERATTRVESKLFSHVEIIGERGTAAGQFNKPRSLALDTNDNLFVADMTGRIQKFSADGKYLLSWEMPITELGRPKGMSCDRSGNIVVLEPHYQRVNVFTPMGKLVSQWGRSGTNAGEFMLPRAVAINSKGEVIVPEFKDSERVQKFSSRGELLVTFGKAGLAPGEFNRAEGAAIDAADRIYIADSCNHRIQVFTPDGKFLRAYGKSGRAPGELSYPYDICIDREGRQYVCEFGSSRIQVFDANDRLIETIGRPGDAPGEFANPWSVALDSKGNLYVADSRNHRVQKFIRSVEGRRSKAERRPSTFDLGRSTAS
ncbi:MAG TPA: 6-bladed beta-propeller [Candidatus Acidoferrum sp.]|nr:6-bladed beta-propeller [Candidatus Acidoferrum sp.]